MPEYIIIAIKSTVAFFVLFLFARLLGKKQITQLTIFDFIVAITIGSIAATASVEWETKTSNALTGMAVWTFWAFLLSFVDFRNLAARKLLDGEPAIVIQNGKILEQNMLRSRYNINDLLTQLRGKGVFDISEVESAVLEPDGSLSVLKKSQYRAATPSDHQLSTAYKGLSSEIIIDGDIIHQNLVQNNLDQAWLLRELHRRGITDVADVVYAELDTLGNLYIDLKDDLLNYVQEVEDTK